MEAEVLLSRSLNVATDVYMRRRAYVTYHRRRILISSRTTTTLYAALKNANANAETQFIHLATFCPIIFF